MLGVIKPALDQPPRLNTQQTNVVLLLVHRLRCWANIKPTLIPRLVFTDKSVGDVPANTKR